VSPRIYQQDPAVYWNTWAHKECNALIRHDPRNCWAHLRQAQLYIEEKKFAEAEESMQKVSRIDPNFQKHLQLEVQGDFAMKKDEKDIDTALKFYKQSATIKPEYFEVYIKMGKCFEKDKDFENATKNF